MLADVDAPPRVLLISRSSAWQHAARDAAAQLGADLQVLPDVPAALHRLLLPDNFCTHLLAEEPLSVQEADALTGMADEVTRRATPVLLLGDGGGRVPELPYLAHPDAGALAGALRAGRNARADTVALTREEVRHGLNAGWLRMRFQPLVRATDLQPLGVETLARLHHPTRGILHPEDFLPQAIACGQERVFTAIMSARAMLDMQGLRLPGLSFSINLPIPVFSHEFTVERALMMAAVVQLDPVRVAIEVLETADEPDMRALEAAITRWRRAGFNVLIDDAGPGLPHWRALAALPFTGLKVDRALASAALQAQATEIAAEAKRRGLMLIAEGIETEHALARARNLGADAVQGYFVSRPLPALALPVWIDAWQREQATLSRVH